MEETEVMNHPTITNPLIAKLKVGSYEFDGFKLWKANVDKYKGGKRQLLKDINQKVIEFTGFNVVFDIKEPDEYYDCERLVRFG